MGKKILTLDDLVDFCLKNKIFSYDSANTNSTLCVQVPAVFEKIDDDDLSDVGMLYMQVRMMHDGINRNQSKISKNNLIKASSSVKYRPILANFKEVEDKNGENVLDFTSHDFTVNDDGTITYQERQVGCFTNKEPYLVYDEKRKKDFLYAIAAIPREYTKTAEILERKNGTKVSVELDIEKMAYDAKDKTLELIDFYVSGCTLLGEDVGEGMESARADITDITDFSAKNNSIVDYAQQMVEMRAQIDSLNTRFNDIQDLTKGGKDTVELKELMTKYSVTKEDITFDTDNLTSEELEAKFKEAFGKTDDGESADDGSTVTPEGESVKESAEDKDSDEKGTTVEDADDGAVANDNACGGCGGGSGSGSGKKKKKYTVENEDDTSVSFEISLNEKIGALTDLVNITYAEADNTYYYVIAYDSYLIMQDICNGRNYRQNYSDAEDGKYVLQGDREEVFVAFVTASEQDALDANKKDYESLKQFKADIEYKELHSAREKVLSDEHYDSIKNVAEFASLVSNIDNYSCEDLTKEADAILGKSIKEGKVSFAATSNKDESDSIHKTRFSISTKTNKKNAPSYGCLFSNKE